MNISIKSLLLTVGLFATTASLYCSDALCPKIKQQLINIGQENLAVDYPGLSLSNNVVWKRINELFELSIKPINERKPVEADQITKAAEQIQHIAYWANFRAEMQDIVDARKEQEERLQANAQREQKRKEEKSELKGQILRLQTLRDQQIKEQKELILQREQEIKEQKQRDREQSQARAARKALKDKRKQRRLIKK